MYTIRKATPDDQQAIWLVRTRAIRETCRSHYTQQEIDTWSSRPVPDNFAEVIAKNDFLVAEADGVIVGTGFLTRRTSQIDALFVNPDYQRRHIGASILKALEQIAVDAELSWVHLSSTINAVDFYKAAGYKVLAQSKYCIPAGLSLDCVHMEKMLSVTP